MARYKISSTGCQVLIFYMFVFDLIHESVLEQNVQNLWQKIRPTVLKMRPIGYITSWQVCVLE